MIGVLVNTAAVIIGSLVGLLLKKGIPERLSDAIMKGIGLCTIYIGISGSLKGQNTLVLIISMVVGGAIGALCDLDGGLKKLAGLVEAKFKKGKTDGKPAVSLAEGFVTASLFFCVGAMTVVGSLNAGLGDNELLLSKSVLDLISSVILASSLGLGVMFSALFVLVFQGALALCAGFLLPFLGDYVIAEMTCAGSVLIIALGLNIIGLTKFKIMNYLPAIFLPMLLCQFIK